LKNYSYSIWKGVLKACGVSKDCGEGEKCKETGTGAKSSFFAKKEGEREHARKVWLDRNPRIM
jgi:hypothetical protein